MSDTFIPPATANLMNGEIPKGTRHATALKIAIPLIGNGLSPTAVFAELRQKFDADMSDKELENVVDWAVKAGPTPSGFKNNERSAYREFKRAPSKPVPPPKPPVEQVAWWLNGEVLSIDAVIASSPYPVPTENKDAARLFFELLYGLTERVNIVCDYTMDGKKANPKGSGKIETAEEWDTYIAINGTPKSDAGAWIRMNPVKPEGSGKDGAITDADVTAHRFILLESDLLPLPQQLALYRRLRLPISLIVMSGGKSVHAWIKVDASDRESYSATKDRLFSALKPFGIDQANGNPSRLSRLPGASRKIGAVDGGEQRLLWINTNPKPFGEKEIQEFETSLRFPILEDKPFSKVVLEAPSRYDELYRNRGKLGIPTGIPEFDEKTGGLKPSTMTIIAAETNGGKSTVALNIVNSALKAGYGVLLFTLEMDREEICDMLISMNCRVSRNSFNTGNFFNAEFDRIRTGIKQISELPLWIEDGATLKAEELDLRTKQLAAEKKIGLVVVDYIQIMAADEDRDSREQQVAKIANAIRATCKETKLAFIVLSQLNDEGKLRESRVIAHAAQNVILLEAKDGNMTLTVKKGRQIPKGDYVTIYEPEFCSINPQPRIEQYYSPPEEQPPLNV